MKPTIAFTGGHYNSSLVIAKALLGENYPVVWFGHKYVTTKDKALSAEYIEVTANNIPFYTLKAGKFYRHFNPLEYLKIGFGFIQAFVYLLRTRPSLIISFGGYLAVPVVISGFTLRIPSITHEQTAIVGWANKAMTPFVKKIMVAHSSSTTHFPKGKVTLVGMPIEAEIANKKNKKNFSPPLLFITCGKQGSHTINKAVFPIIPELVKHYTVVHQLGSASAFKDASFARRLKERMGDLAKRYHTAPYFFGKEYATYLRSAAIIVSRCGAHTCYKIAYLKKRSVLIPIPWVSHNEQMENARLTKKFAPTIILEEGNLNPDSLYHSIITAGKLPRSSSKQLDSTDATTKILDIVHRFV